MTHIQQQIQHIRCHIPKDVTLVCVSKFHPADAIAEAYAIGERDFGESRVQELIDKHEHLPQDIRWHMIGHLQTNKVRAIIPFVHLIHSVDSTHLLDTIQREAARIDRIVDVLLEVHVAREQTKSGFDPTDYINLMHAITHGEKHYPNVRIRGLMTMATNTDDETEIRRCFHEAKSLLDNHIPNNENDPLILSCGMSDDYPIAICEGSNMIRIGTTIFGQRTY